MQQNRVIAGRCASAKASGAGGENKSNIKTMSAQEITTLSQKNEKWLWAGFQSLWKRWIHFDSANVRKQTRLLEVRVSLMMMVGVEKAFNINTFNIDYAMLHCLGSRPCWNNRFYDAVKMYLKEVKIKKKRSRLLFFTFQAKCITAKRLLAFFRWASHFITLERHVNIPTQAKTSLNHTHTRVYTHTHSG